MQDKLSMYINIHFYNYIFKKNKKGRIQPHSPYNKNIITSGKNLTFTCNYNILSYIYTKKEFIIYQT